MIKTSGDYVLLIEAFAGQETILKTKTIVSYVANPLIFIPKLFHEPVE